MLRRLALLAALLVPSAGLAQATGEVLVIPSTFGRVSCASPATISIAWFSLVTPLTFPTSATPDFYRIKVSNTSGCADSSGSVVTGTLVDTVTASGQTQVYPTPPDTLTALELFSLAGVTDCTAAAATAYVCVEHWPNGGGASGATPKWKGIGQAKLEVDDPPVPVIVSVAPGDSSLFISWIDGTSTGVTATKYNVTAVGSTGSSTLTFTSKSNQRFHGLTNGVTYTVTITAVSAGGNESLASAEATGTPQHVSDFWEQYQDVPGRREEGGCGGGPAGALSLLGVALALRGLRRRS
jgi:Fibronectin type III domain